MTVGGVDWSSIGLQLVFNWSRIGLGLVWDWSGIGLGFRVKLGGLGGLGFRQGYRVYGAQSYSGGSGACDSKKGLGLEGLQRLIHVISSYFGL